MALGFCWGWTLMIGFGVVGCGRIADRHMMSLAASKGATLAALCDLLPERMERAEQLYRRHTETAGPIERCSSLEQLLSSPRVAAVVVSTHSAKHAELALAALQAGKHVLLEKPMALSLADADRIVRTASERGLYVQVCHQLRYRPVFQYVRELVQDGAFGKLHMAVVSLRLRRSRSYYEEAAWRGSWKLDGGMLLNQGSHLIDLLQWFLGDATSVYGTMTRGSLEKQTEDTAAGIVQFAGGGVGVIEANTLSHPNNLDNTVTLFGEKGTVSIGGLQLDDVRRWSFDDPKLTAPVNIERDEHERMYAHVIQAIDRKQPLLADAAEGRKTLELICGLYESVRTNAITVMPLRAFSTEWMADPCAQLPQVSLPSISQHVEG